MLAKRRLSNKENRDSLNSAKPFIIAMSILARLQQKDL